MLPSKKKSAIYIGGSVSSILSDCLTTLSKLSASWTEHFVRCMYSVTISSRASCGSITISSRLTVG